MKKNTIVALNEQGRRKFPNVHPDKVFLFDSEIPNNPQYVIVRGFRGRFAVGEEFVENVDDLYELSLEEVADLFDGDR